MVCTMSFNHLKFQAIYNLQYLFMAVVSVLLLVNTILILHLEGWSGEMFGEEWSVEGLLTHD